MQAETRLKAKVLKYLSTLDNVWVYKSSDKFRSGIPDILICDNGAFVAIELKTRYGNLSKLQKYELNRIDKAGGETLVCRSLQEVKEIMED